MATYNVCDTCEHGREKRPTSGFGLRPYCKLEQCIQILNALSCSGHKSRLPADNGSASTSGEVDNE